MADSTISNLPANTAVDPANDALPLVHNGTTQKVTPQSLVNSAFPQVPFTPSGSISATTVNTAILELDTEKAAISALPTAMSQAVAQAGTSTTAQTISAAVLDSAVEYGAFTPAGTGAVSRTVQSKLRDVVSVFDFMTATQIADITSYTASIDVSSNIQSVIDQVYANGGGEIVFPNGMYLIRTTINLKSNIRYSGVGASSLLPTSPYLYKGATLKWGGISSGFMVSAINTWNVIWDGISLLGNWGYAPGWVFESPTPAVNGINFASDPATSVSGINSQRNYFKNFTIVYCNTAIVVGLEGTPNAGNNDGWVIEQFLITDCYKGIYTICYNIAYSDVRNGFISTWKAGLDIKYSGYLRVVDVGFYGYLDSGVANTGCINISGTAGILIFELLQGEDHGSAGYDLLYFYDGVKSQPTTIVGTAFDMPVRIDSPQKALTFIGNVWNSPCTIASSNSNIVSISDYSNTPGGAFQEITPYTNNISIQYNDGYGIFIPTLLKGTTPITVTSSVCTWKKINRMVYISFTITASGSTSSASGNYTIGNLPFYSSPRSEDGLSYIIPYRFVVNGVEQTFNTPYTLTIGTNKTEAVLQGNNASTNWTSGNLILQGAGWYQTDVYGVRNP